MNRNDFKALAQIRLKEARVLLEDGCYEGAYYLCGYAVECALKARIAKLTKRYDFPPNKKTIEKIYTHDLDTLVIEAKLQTELQQEIKSDPTFAGNWYTVKDWSEQSRYEKRTEIEARQFCSSVSDKRHGVLRWIKKYW